MRERNEPRLGVARFDELCGLRLVFSQDKSAGNLIVNSEVPQRGFCGASVGRSRRIRNRNLLHRTVEQSLHAELRYVPWRVARHPQHQPADGIAIKSVLRCQSLGDQLTWIFFVGREEHIEGRPVSYLIGQVAGRAELNLLGLYGTLSVSFDV